MTGKQRVLIIRHAVAVKKEKFAKTGEADALRPLTRRGFKEMRRAARGLNKILEDDIDVLAASPLVRARQTLEIVREELGKTRVEIISELQPDRNPKEAARWLKECGRKRVALIGHEPHLSRLIAVLCGIETGTLTDLKKGQCSLLEIDRAKPAMPAKILWSLESEQLKRIR